MRIDFEGYGVTYRQFDHWCRNGWVRSRTEGGSGSSRDFTKAESDIFKILANLVTIGFRPVVAAELARNCVERGWNGSLRLFRGRFEATGILSARGSVELRPGDHTQPPGRALSSAP
jgi:hypothetical protein